MTEIETKVTESPSNKEIRRNRFKLLGILMVFALPVLTAYLGYFGGWFSGVSTSNKGELLNPIPPITEFLITRAGKPVDDKNIDGKWWLLLVDDGSTCGELCQIQIYTLNQTVISLGKEQERVRFAVVVNDNTTEPVMAADSFSAHLPELAEQWQAAVSAQGITGSAAAVLHTQSIYLVDPMGNVVLRYLAPQNKDEALLRHKDIKADITKLLKFSHIG